MTGGRLRPAAPPGRTSSRGGEIPAVSKPRRRRRPRRICSSCSAGRALADNRHAHAGSASCARQRRAGLRACPAIRSRKSEPCQVCLADEAALPSWGAVVRGGHTASPGIGPAIHGTSGHKTREPSLPGSKRRPKTFLNLQCPHHSLLTPPDEKYKRCDPIRNQLSAKPALMEEVRRARVLTTPSAIFFFPN
ncbi:hypothetical protein TREES_T100002805 [Tupaia chinensis]|uniref:Uncharacterized protein n=1 Tax=Tupaia chinensis TaxID=246437 RepID=L9KXL4_TUPCH|nr:hypothetical protein TREES_T100002805 [Tupaia chinensis]